ncbi:MAG: AAA family ATPase [Euryarchaeota archaeon]|nr:AAA family ATPase [Euryarchaeota archaeon]
MFQIAVYGKGGIGKSTISANLSYALAEKGKRVLHIGCDPKHDSTRLLLGGANQTTVLDYMKEVPSPERNLEDLVLDGSMGVKCVEAGGPEPGIGCAGRGIISTFNTLENLGIDRYQFDIKLYDVLGDVVCGGFAIPLRKEYADAVYLVTSGEFMSIYAANNILKGMRNFDSISPRVAGLIFNSRGRDEEEWMIESFARAVGLPIIVRMPRSDLFAKAERNIQTVVEIFPNSEPTRVIKSLADHVLLISEGSLSLKSPHPLSDEQLNDLAAGRALMSTHPGSYRMTKNADRSDKPYVNRRPIHTCATNGAYLCTSQIRNSASIIHGPRSCAHILATYADRYALRSWKRRGRGRIEPTSSKIYCTEMDERASIFGGIDVLEKLVIEKIDEGHKIIFIITTCVSGIIGDDVESLVERIEVSYPEVIVKIVESDGNITGEWDQGYLDAVKEIVELIDSEILPDKNYVNIVGELEFIIQNNDKNFTEIQSMLDRLGVNINCRFLYECDVDSVIGFKRGSLNLLAKGDLLTHSIKNILEKDVGAIFFDLPLPMGFQETEKWIRELAEHIEKVDAGRALTEELRIEYNKGIADVKPWMKDRKIIIMDRFSYNIGWLLDLLQDLGSNIIKVGIGPRRFYELQSDDDAIASFHNEKISFQYDYTMEDLKRDVALTKPDLILTDHRIPLIDDVRHDIIHRPSIGIRGSIDLAKRWANIIRLPLKEGWKLEVNK